MRHFKTMAVLALLSLLPGAAEAETVSRKQALQLATAFFNQAAGRVQAPPRLVYDGRRLTTDRLFAPFYVFNQPTGGFVIISAENKTFPILGYSLKENFDPETMGDAGKALLAGYAREVEMIRYDSRVPEQAIAAWTDFPAYVASLLEAPTYMYDGGPSPDNARKSVERMVSDPNPEDYSSDIYSLPQWQSMADARLSVSGPFPVGFLGNGSSVQAAVVNGRKGDYYRIVFPDHDNWFMRLGADEFNVSAMFADFTHHAPEAENSEDEEVPFVFLDEFEHEVSDAERSRLSGTDDIQFTRPEIRGIGGGHYEISMPEEVRMVMVYSLGGRIVAWHTYADTDVAYLDLSAAPSGFYFIRAYGESGTAAGFKVHR